MATPPLAASPQIPAGSQRAGQAGGEIPRWQQAPTPSERCQRSKRHHPRTDGTPGTKTDPGAVLRHVLSPGKARAALQSPSISPFHSQLLDANHKLLISTRLHVNDLSYSKKPFHLVTLLLLSSCTPDFPLMCLLSSHDSFSSEFSCHLSQEPQPMERALRRERGHPEGEGTGPSRHPSCGCSTGH